MRGIRLRIGKEFAHFRFANKKTVVTVRIEVLSFKKMLLLIRLLACAKIHLPRWGRLREQHRRGWLGLENDICGSKRVFIPAKGASPHPPLRANPQNSLHSFRGTPLWSPCLAAARSHSGSDSRSGCHSLPSCRFATRWGRLWKCRFASRRGRLRE